MIEFVSPRPKTYSYLMNYGCEHKKAKIKKELLYIKRILKFNDYENWLFNNEIKLKSQERFNVYTKQINKISLSSNDNKRLQTFDRIPTYPHGTNAFKVYESEILTKYK